MKLYYAPGACSLSPHIVLHESGLQHELVRADLGTHTLAEGGADFYAINPKGYVPVLELDSGERLTEGPAIIQYIADQVPDKHLAPPNGTLARYHLQEWLNFITAELHKGYGPLFNPAMPAEAKAIAKKKLLDRLQWVDGQLGRSNFLLGDAFSVADAYLYTVTNWAKRVDVDLAPFAALTAYRARVGERPAVKAAMQMEGLTGLTHRVPAGVEAGRRLLSFDA